MPGWLKFACTRSNRWMRFRCESLELGRAAGSNSNRVWARYSADGRWVNGKSTPAIHQIYSSNDFNRDGLELIRRGYAMIGASFFNAGVNRVKES